MASAEPVASVNGESRGKGKGKAREEDVKKGKVIDTAQGEEAFASLSATPTDQEDGSSDAANVAATPKLTMAERMAKMKQLQGKMAATSRANRKDLVTEQKKAKEPVFKKDTTNSRKLAKAERMLDERDEMERGEDIDRNRNWQYSIEDSERWENKLEQKEEMRDKGAVDFETAAERSYNRKIRELKPNVKAYQATRDEPLVGAADAGPSSASSSLIRRQEEAGDQLISRSDLDSAYAHLSYGDHKPSDADVDRLVTHLNLEKAQRQKRGRSREEDPDGEVTYINDYNKRFNEKVKRFYDKYTTEIRENFERGTAL
ncbi:SYF2-domain-containing protein [Tilletiaria anomala UBC 951]|uniref:Pre-mRNA-splicing factor SYF2 n=1 Tax=Tilletiaria anomala (strain ATCC 24038 / CBS 436.72 / UBC 951) TaxID=1037660 RepID=A0A066VY61_TILAU|nr:SYF2-domain-containing protein [Tilletiaria anomala UBC 951]KDN45228.1 SYF2-domain-containing protein [Tilletiaria anomala UBC 951]